ncbi:MAG: hypothetical protein ACK41Q_13185 [Candidatus Brocadia sp.]
MAERLLNRFGEDAIKSISFERVFTSKRSCERQPKKLEKIAYQGDNMSRRVKIDGKNKKKRVKETYFC